MRRVLADRQTQIWVVLLIATALTGVLGLDGPASHAVGVILMAIAIFKLRLVARYFMEVATAPRLLRLIIEVYAVGLFVVLSAVYLAA